MNNDNNHDHDGDPVDPEFDARARAAGRALREPAPARGFEQVRSAKRRRTVAQAGAAIAVGVLAVGGIFALVRSGDDDLQPADAPDSVPTVITPGTTVDSQPTGQPATSPATNQPTITDPASTVPPVDSAVSDSTDVATDSTTPTDKVDYVAAGKYAGPTFDERTSAITDPLEDGLYYSREYTSDGTAVTFRLIQRIRGQACIDEFGDGADEACASDGGTIEDPSTAVTMSADTADTSIIFFDNSDFFAYRVPADEFIRLAAGQGPSDGAPEGFEWIPWGTYVTIQSGRVVAAHQQFSS